MVQELAAARAGAGAEPPTHGPAGAVCVTSAVLGWGGERSGASTIPAVIGRPDVSVWSREMAGWLHYKESQGWAESAERG